MAVQILNEMPDAEVHRGDPVEDFLRDLNAPRERRSYLTGRAVFLAATIALHLIVGLAFLQMQTRSRVKSDPEPIIVSLIEAPSQQDQTPPEYTPPPVNVVYELPVPQDISIETEAITPAVIDTAISTSTSHVSAPPMVDSVEYLRSPPPLYPRESQRKRERGIVMLRVLVDTSGRPAQIQLERSSGFERLDNAALEAVAQFLFRPYEVNGVKQAAQVLIPIGFDPPAS
jgi:protein TonB